MLGNNGINCTVVELKQRCRFYNHGYLDCINCTVVELKHTITGRKKEPIVGINCTVVELKPWKLYGYSKPRGRY